MVERCCPFCDAPVADWGLAFYEHVEDEPLCREAWEAWTRVVREEAGES